jgi:arsenite-transporting ATPase
VRVLLFTGKGGVGKTTTAAATAAVAAARGAKVLVLSTDSAHSLADAFGRPLADAPTEVEPGLYGLQVDTQAAFERSWSQVQGYLQELLARGGADPLVAEELTVLPGAEEVLALLELRAQVASGRWDVVVVDCAPTGETLRLLALPQVLTWYVEKAFPAQRRVLRAARPLLGRRNGIPLPGDGVLAAASQLLSQLAEVRDLLAAPSTSVRLVLTPEAVVVAEARRTMTSLALYGHRVDEVVVNRVFPASPDPFLAGWARAQGEQLAAVRRDLGALATVREQAYRPAEPVGVDALRELGEQLYAGADPVGAAGEPADLLTVDREGEQFVLGMPLPLADRSELDLARSGDDLVVTVAGRRRLVALPSVLVRCEVAGASLAGGRLLVRFRPDPSRWPEALIGR